MDIIDNCIIPDWPAPNNVKALQTTRNGGVSVTPYCSLNLGSHVGDAPLAVARNRQLLSPLLPSEPVWLNQMHGIAVANASMTVSNFNSKVKQGSDERTTKIVQVARLGVSEAVNSASALADSGLRTFSEANAVSPMNWNWNGCLPQADACIATQAGAVCVVMTADCLPVLLCDERGSVVGAVHAGWRGLCAGILEQAVRSMNVPPQNLMAWLGPAIGPQAFEVGDDVRSAFIARQPLAAAAFAPKIPGKWLADIYQLARLRLKALGVTQIYGGNWCTFTDSAHFFSFRRDGNTGRMGTFIWMD